jgi:wyosine [tRNA(Phe)-imidazoG37] synthetase (radical SAM superfamily)
LGRTTNKTIERKNYVAIDGILAELERKLADKDTPDYVTLSGSGEPTLNSGIGDLIPRIKRLTDIPVAVLTNGSLLWMRETQDALMAADLVLPSADAGDELLFRYVNRPHSSISFDLVAYGLATFAGRFKGQLWLEVFLLGGVTGIPAEVEKIAATVRRIGPARVQLNTVSRPPAEDFALPVDQDQLAGFLGFFSGAAEVIGEDDSSPPRRTRVTGTTGADVLALLRRRPCTARDVAVGLNANTSEVAKRLHALLQQRVIRTERRNGVLFYRA